MALLRNKQKGTPYAVKQALPLHEGSFPALHITDYSVTFGSADYGLEMLLNLLEDMGASTSSNLDK
jgi:hypothetical protein